MFDLDHFKEFNDRYGHLAGDDALRAVADVLRTQTRSGDVIGRFGGEEFAVVLADADVRIARSYFDRVARHLSELDDPRIGPLSTSAGISVSADASTADTLFGHADGALYAAKASGRARCAWFEGGVVHTSSRLPT